MRPHLAVHRQVQRHANGRRVYRGFARTLHGEMLLSRLASACKRGGSAPRTRHDLDGRRRGGEQAQAQRVKFAHEGSQCLALLFQLQPYLNKD
jgi:hypothetical protein